MRLACAAVVSLTILLSGACVKDVRYRYFDGENCRGQNCVNLPARQEGPGWELAYIEFNDDGEAWAPVQTQKAADLIRQAKSENDGAAVVLLYVHGWKNNANEVRPPQRKDVEKFKTALDRVAVSVSQLKQPGRLPRLVGIYIGWRGATANMEPLKTLTMWPRRATARRVGRNGVFESVAEIVKAAKPTPTDPTRLILVGHSFGARVLENAVDGLDARDQRQGPMLAWQGELANARAVTSPAPPVDLVVYVNAATQSTISERTIRRLRDAGAVYYGPGGSVESCKDDPTGNSRPECRPLPLYVAVSSTGDLATRYLLPISGLLIPPGPFPWRLRSAAFTGRLQSHVVTEETECPTVPPHRCLPKDDVELCFEANRNEERVCYQVKRKEKRTNDTPFWAMSIDPRVVTDHGDIWNQNLLDLFEAVLQRSRAADVTASRVLVTR